MSYDWSRVRGSGHRLLVWIARAGAGVAKSADRFLRPHGLTLSQLDLLAILFAEPDGIPQARLGEELSVSRANVTGVVRRLQRRGLVLVGRDASDARVRRVRIAARGKALLRRIEPAYFRAVRRTVRGISAADLDAAAGVLRKIGDRAGEA